MSVRYRVRFLRSAEKELAKLDPSVRVRVLRHIAALVDDPRPPGVTRLVGADGLWRIRIGDYRVVYEIHDDQLIIRIIRVAHRGDLRRLAGEVHVCGYPHPNRGGSREVGGVSRGGG